MDQITAFLEAVKRGDTSAVVAMLGARPPLAGVTDEHGKTGLHWAAETNRADVAQVLMEAGADIEARTVWGASPLDWAATMGSADVAELLLSRGAGGSTLITAAALGKQRAVEEIVESAADLSPHRRRDAPELPTDHWPADTAHLEGDVLSDALYAAARNGHRSVVEYLLGHGAKVDAKGVFGATALHWAAFHGHAATVELLVSRGASLSIRDARFGATPSGWADEGGHREIAAALRLDPREG